MLCWGRRLDLQERQSSPLYLWSSSTSHIFWCPVLFFLLLVLLLVVPLGYLFVYSWHLIFYHPVWANHLYFFPFRLKILWGSTLLNGFSYPFINLSHISSFLVKSFLVSISTLFPNLLVRSINYKCYYNWDKNNKNQK